MPVDSVSGRATWGFGRLLEWHFDRGTRPNGEIKKWSYERFAKAVEKSENTIRNWFKGRNLPTNIGRIEMALFGEDPAKDKETYKLWRHELRNSYELATASSDEDKFSTENPIQVSRSTSSAQTISNYFMGKKRNPIVHWHHTYSDKKRNEYLDEEPAPVDFFVSVGAFANAGSQITIRMKDRPGPHLKIKSITLVRLNPEVVKRLTTAQLLHPDFEQLLQERIRLFVREVGNDSRDIRILVRLWSDIPSFHGYLFSKRRFSNQWAFNDGKLHVDVPLLEYPSPDWDAETEEAIRAMSNCELEAEYLHGRKISP